MKRRVAFQGEPGAFSQVAARRLGGEDCMPVPMQSFEEVFVSVQNGKSKFAAVIPIENTLHGSVHENYDLLLKFDLVIRGGTFVRIVHNLIAPPGVRFSQMKRVLFASCGAESVPALLRRESADRENAFLRYGGQRQDGDGEALTDAGAIASAEPPRNLWRQDSEEIDRRRPRKLHAILSARKAAR